MNDLIMPAEFYGEIIKSNGSVKTNPRVWTEPEVEWILEKKALGYKNDQIAKAIGRSEVSLQIKLARVRKVKNLYNSDTRDIKYMANKEFLQKVEPVSILDLYAGDSWYKKYPKAKLTTNDKDEKFDTDYHLDAIKLLCKLTFEGKRFDLIDLDPYGSAYECLDLAVRQTDSALIVSFGEWGQKRWLRYDYVGPRYGIWSIEEFTEDKFITTVQNKALLQGKKLTTIKSIQYTNFLRVYFTVDKL
jgi:hypothetical protein